MNVSSMGSKLTICFENRKVIVHYMGPGLFAFPTWSISPSCLLCQLLFLSGVVSVCCTIWSVHFSVLYCMVCSFSCLVCCTIWSVHFPVWHGVQFIVLSGVLIFLSSMWCLYGQVSLSLATACQVCGVNMAKQVRL